MKKDEIVMWYLQFLEKKKLNLADWPFYIFLYFLSLIYGAIVFTRNYFYDHGFKQEYKITKKVISLGNISWAGTGKTTLAGMIYNKLSTKYNCAILRRGYGKDEEMLLKEKCPSVFSGKDRVKLAKELEGKHDVFILDDGFQYRHLKRDLNIVIMGAKEFLQPIKLIPISFFREPLASLKRADIVIVNYSKDLGDLAVVKRQIFTVKSSLKIYFANYIFNRLLDLEENEVSLDTIKNYPIALFTAIGNPLGFINKLKELKLEPKHKIIYPDHYQLSEDDFLKLEKQLTDGGIKYLIITAKDKYHLPFNFKTIKVIVLEVKMVIEKEDDFWKGLYESLGI